MRATWLESGAPVEAEDLTAAGLHYAQLPIDPEAYQAPLDALSADRGYITQDVVELTPETPNLDTICAMYDKEHHHSDDEARFVIGGEGIFDVRSADDRWMRIEVVAGDLLVVPHGCHHRFLLNEKRTIRCVRLFVDPAGWAANYRNG